MNIYQFIESKEITKHCKHLKYQFSPLEMAVIIRQSSKLLDEKLSAYQKIIDEYPDMKISGNEFFQTKKSLHKYLETLIKKEKDTKAKFLATEENAIYGLYVDGFRLCFSPFYTKAKNQSVKSIIENLDEEQNDVFFDKVEVIKEYSGAGFFENLVATVDHFGEIYRIDDMNEDEFDDLLDLTISLPTPFRQGDIIFFKGKVRVLDEILPDMSVSCYYFNDEGKFDHDVFPTGALSMKSNDNDLVGKELFLDVLSRHMKDEFGYEILFAMYDLVTKAGEFETLKREFAELLGDMLDEYIDEYDDDDDEDEEYDEEIDYASFDDLFAKFLREEDEEGDEDEDEE